MYSQRNSFTLKPLQAGITAVRHGSISLLCIISDLITVLGIWESNKKLE
jgi:hypothetical protein